MTQFGRIGVLAENAQQIGELTRLVRGAGFKVDATADVAHASTKLPEVDIWVVDLDVDSPSAMACVEQLDAEDKYVIFANDLHANEPIEAGEKPLLPAELRKKRERRLARKLGQWVAPGTAKSSAKRAKTVWVLAASTGGPEAVMAFLSKLSEPLQDVALIYAQHTEPAALSHLAKTVAAKSPWPVSVVDKPLTLCAGQVYLVSPLRQMDVLEGGLLTVSHKPWAGQFSPSLDQVIAKVARVYGAQGGAIVFSGMGDDGAQSCNMMCYRGGQVWVQSPESCAVDSMPVSVKAKSRVHIAGTPEQLAEQFKQFQKTGKV